MNKSSVYCVRERAFSRSITSKHVFSVLFFLIWTKDIIIQYSKAVFNKIPIVSMFTEEIISSLYIVLTMISLGYIIKNLRKGDILIFFVVPLVCILSVIIYPKNEFFQYNEAFTFIATIFSLYYIGVSLKIKDNYKIIYIASLVCVFATFVYETFINDAMSEIDSMYSGNMNASYRLLPHLLVVLSAFFYDKSLINILASVLGVLMTLSFGTRGPIVVIFVFIVMYLYFCLEEKKKLIFMFSATGIFGLIILFFDQIMILAYKFTLFAGLSERIFIRYYNGELIETSGRNTLYEIAMQYIGDNPLVGLGVAGDRTILNTYSHNILLELFISFGVPIGLALIVVFFFYFKKSMMLSNNYERMFLLVLFCASFVKLLMSGSYLHEGNFFLCIGVIIGIARRSSSYEGFIN